MRFFRTGFSPRFVACLVASAALPLLILFVPPIAPQNGWWWDMAMAAGMLGAGLMIALPLLSPRASFNFHCDPRVAGLVLRFHSDLSYVVVALCFFHITGLLLVDGLVLEYLKLSAPWSQLGAIVSTLLLVSLIISSQRRRRRSVRYRVWRHWHVAMSSIAMALLAWHVIDAGLYVNSALKTVSFLCIAAAPSVIAFGLRNWRASIDASASDAAILRAPPGFSPRFVSLITIFCLCALVVFAVPKPDSRAENQALKCQIEACE